MLSEPLPPTTMRPSRPRSAKVSCDLVDAVGVVVGAPPLGAEHGAALGQRAAHDVDGERHRAALADAVPGVEEADDLVAVVALALAHDGAEHRVEPGAVAAAGQDPDTHEGRLEVRAGSRGAATRHASAEQARLLAGSMAWDSSRPVPYRRLLKEWAIYAAIMLAVVLVLLRDSKPRRPDRPAWSVAAAVRRLQRGDGEVRLPAQDAGRDAARPDGERRLAEHDARRATAERPALRRRSGRRRTEPVRPRSR